MRFRLIDAVRGWFDGVVFQHHKFRSYVRSSDVRREMTSDEIAAFDRAFTKMDEAFLELDRAFTLKEPKSHA